MKLASATGTVVKASEHFAAEFLCRGCGRAPSEGQMPPHCWAVCAGCYGGKDMKYLTRVHTYRRFLLIRPPAHPANTLNKERAAPNP